MKRSPDTKGLSTKNAVIKANEHYEPKPKQYCCLHHYMQGKQTKGTSPCNNHVSLGVINPITTLTRQEKQIIKDAKSKPSKYESK